MQQGGKAVDRMMGGSGDVVGCNGMVVVVVVMGT